MEKAEHIKVIEKVVMAALADDFDDVRILQVEATADVDFDGDDILRIDVIFAGQPKDLDARKLSGAVRHVRPQLIGLGEDAFPVFSFISAKDAGKSLATA